MDHLKIETRINFECKSWVCLRIWWKFLSTAWNRARSRARAKYLSLRPNKGKAAVLGQSSPLRRKRSGPPLRRARSLLSGIMQRCYTRQGSFRTRHRPHLKLSPIASLPETSNRKLIRSLRH